LELNLSYPDSAFYKTGYTMTLKIYLLATCMAACTLLYAQNEWEIGGGLGINAYQGDVDDISSNFTLTKTNIAANAHLRRVVGNHIGLRLNAHIGKISGDEKLFKEPAWRRTRGFAFESLLAQGAFLAELYPFGIYKKVKLRRDSAGNVIPRFRVRENGDTLYISPKMQLKKTTLYLTAGLGMHYANPKVQWNETGGTNPNVPADLILKDKNAPMSRLNLSVPFGAGLRFAVGPKTALSLESMLHYTGYDYLDGISESANPKKEDWFFSTMLVLSHGFGKQDPDQDQDGISDVQDRCPTLFGPRNTGGCPDSDKDGYPDNEDLCPEVAGLLKFKGCPDTDKDGLPDAQDKCPDMAGPTKFNGCPDKDRDNVQDAEDLCPDVAGLPEFKGCPDTDKDGVPDSEDNCPEVKGSKTFRGCPAVDKDNDGVADDEDKCPDMPGQLKWEGCPDSDGDGLADNVDDCPSIPGSAEFTGCPDSDRDGIPDQKDKCPTVFGSKQKEGCPEQPGAPSAWAPYKAIYFGSTLQDWQSASKTTLDEVYQILSADPALKARVEGHTDNTGDKPANDLLSEKRAKRCYDTLIAKGINPKRLTYVGYSDKKPIASNDTPQGRQLNRRVEIHFYK
jgi:OmpA-OmpF porin, OOP family